MPPMCKRPTSMPPTTKHTPASRHGMARAVIVVALVVAACSNTPSDYETSTYSLPLRPVAQIPLPGDNSRFDYASLDPQRGLIFIAHLGASEVVEVDVHA